MLNKEEFADKLLDRLKKKMGKQYKIATRNILKENGKRMTGIALIERNSREGSTPVVYVDGYYEEYLEGSDMDKCVETFIRDYSLCEDITFCEMETLTDWENCKEWVYPILINQEMNEELLQKVVHRKYLDLAVCYIIRIPCHEEANIMTRVDEDKLKMWNINEEELHQTAMKNFENDNGQIVGMAEVIKDLINMKMFEADREEETVGRERDDNDGDCENGKEQDEDNCGCGNLAKDDFGMYVLTNQRGYYGAACILNTGVLEAFGRRIQNDFYIIPSSLHEVILVPYVDDTQAQQFQELIKEVNREMLKVEEILSDHAYLYDREAKEVRCV